MVYKIYKYQMGQPVTVWPIDLPIGAEVLKVGVQGGKITFWVKVNPIAGLSRRNFHVFGTGEGIGHDLAGQLHYLDTVQIVEQGMEFVWHVFEEKVK